MEGRDRVGEGVGEGTVGRFLKIRLSKIQSGIFCTLNVIINDSKCANTTPANVQI